MREKIAADRPMRVEREESGIVSFPPPFQGPLSRIRLWAFYEAAGFDLGARRALNTLVSESQNPIDEFLEIIAAERHRHDFSFDEVEQRLYKLYNQATQFIYTRAYELLASAQPPFQIGRVIGSLICLIPGAFVESATELIRRYARSIRDIEEICIGLLLTRMTPPGSGKLLGDLRSKGHSTTEILFNQTLRMLEHSEKPDENQSDRGVRAVCELWAGLARVESVYSRG